jgi:hypothetical protein
LNLADPDTWWHAEVGRQILKAHAVPSLELYSWTAHGSGWIAFQWLGELVIGIAAQTGNLRTMTSLLMLVAAALMLLLYYWAYLTSGSAESAFVSCCILLPLLSGYFTLRPQLFAHLFVLMTLICLEHFRRGRSRAVWFLPPLFLIWVNTHGSFLLGFIVIALYWFSGVVRVPGFEWRSWSAKERLHLAAAALGCVMCLGITPYGTRLAAYPAEMALYQPGILANIMEWRPMPLQSSAAKLFLILIALYLIAVVTLRPVARLDWTALLLFSIFSTFLHWRFLPVFALTFAAPIASLLAGSVFRQRVSTPDASQQQLWTLNAALMLLVSVGICWMIPSRQQLTELVSGLYPQRAVEYLERADLPGSLYHEYGWGGYLMWVRGPGKNVFIDGRADVYEYAGVLADYLSIERAGPSAFPLLRRYGITACLVKTRSPLATLLASSDHWQLSYSDSLSSVYVQQHSSAR